MNDSELMQGLRERNPAAVQSLNDCYLPSLWRFVYIRVDGNQHLAEDILSETVLALIRAAAAPETTIANVEGWLRSVAGNKIADHFRAASRVQHLIDQVLPTLEALQHVDPLCREEREEQHAEVRRVMDDLPTRHRLILEWKYLDKLSVREIAKRMRLTEKAAESVLFRARRDFRERLHRPPDDEDEPGSGQRNLSARNSCRDRVQNQNASSVDARVSINTRDDTATP